MALVGALSIGKQDRTRLPVSGGAAVSPVYDAASVAYFNAMSVQPNDARKRLIDDLIVGLKSDNVWASLYDVVLLGAHDGQASFLNAKAPGTYTAVGQMSPVFVTDRGWTTNGTSYIDLVATPSVADPQSACFGIWVSDDGQFAGSQAGVYTNTTSGNTTIITRNANNAASVRIQSGNTVNSANGSVTSGKGLTVANRLSGNIQIYKNGAQIISASETARTPETRSFYLGGYNGTGGALTSSQTATFLVAVFGASLDALQHAALYNRLNTYITGIGAA